MSLLGRASNSACGFVGASLFRTGGVDTFGRILLEIKEEANCHVMVRIGTVDELVVLLVDASEVLGQT